MVMQGDNTESKGESAVVAYFKVGLVSLHSPEGTEQNYEQCSMVAGALSETPSVTSRITSFLYAS
jgi:hypothetical protein